VTSPVVSFSLQFFCDGLGNQLEFEKDIVFYIEAGRMHGAQGIAPEPLCILSRLANPLLQLVFDFAQLIKEAIRSGWGTSSQFKYLA
jgi:hypothetical protein